MLDFLFVSWIFSLEFPQVHWTYETFESSMGEKPIKTLRKVWVRKETCFVQRGSFERLCFHVFLLHISCIIVSSLLLVSTCQQAIHGIYTSTTLSKAMEGIKESMHLLHTTWLRKGKCIYNYILLTPDTAVDALTHQFLQVPMTFSDIYVFAGLHRHSAETRSPGIGWGFQWMALLVHVDSMMPWFQGHSADCQANPKRRDLESGFQADRTGVPWDWLTWHCWNWMG